MGRGAWIWWVIIALVVSTIIFGTAVGSRD